MLSTDGSLCVFCHSSVQGLGAAATLFRRGSVVFADLAKRRLLVSLEIPVPDRSYPWFLQWMSSQASMQRSRRGLALGLPRRSHQLSVQTNYIQHDNGSTDIRFDLVPGPGTHYFQYRGAWMQVRALVFRSLCSFSGLST
jgi:chaperone BCS1